MFRQIPVIILMLAAKKHCLCGSSLFVTALHAIRYSALYFTVARSAEGSLPGRPAALSWVLRASVPGAFLRPEGGSCRVENLNSSV